MTGRLSRRDMLILGGVVVLALAAALWWLVVAPARSDVSSREGRLAVVTREVNAMRDTVDRLRAEEPGAARRTAERLRLAKALPTGEHTPGAMVQLQDLADRAGVELTSIAAAGGGDYGLLRGSEFELTVTGRFHDVDDFLYRMHNLVSLDQRGRPQIDGRLFALRTVAIVPTGEGAGRSALGPDDPVTATVATVAYSAPPDAAADATSATPTPVTPVTPADPDQTPAPQAPAGGETADATGSGG